MNFFHEVTRKPWEPEQGADGLSVRDRPSLPAARVGLRMFFAVVAVLFLLLSLAYGERMAAAEWRPLPEAWLMWMNTAMLVLSSIAFRWAQVSLRRGQVEGVRTGLFAAGIFTVAFLAGQLLAWQQLAGMNYFAPTNPANTFFYLITGLHGLHLVGGLVAWGHTTGKVWRTPWIARTGLSVELCASYWHFLLIVWLALFGLLFLPGGSLPIICRALIL